MNSLDGKVAIVTGASKGIGAAIAKGLAAAGAKVAVNYASDREGAERAVADIAAKGGKAVAIRADMSKSAEVKRLFEETKKALGTPNVLVNNAGIFEFGPVQDISEAQFHRHFDLNVLGTMLAIQEAIKHFPAEGGSIVNISSIASESPVPNSSLYAATKGAVDTLTLALAKELGPRRSASTPSRQVIPTPRAISGSVSSAARRPKPLSPRRRLAPASAGQKRSLPRSYSWLRTTLPG